METEIYREYGIHELERDWDEIRQQMREIKAKRQAAHEAFLKQHNLTQADYERMKASGEIIPAPRRY